MPKKNRTAAEKEEDMPGFDRTGPFGYGPMSGGQRGYCRPWGRRMRGAYGSFRTKDAVIRDLEYQQEMLKEELKCISEELKDIQNGETTS